MHFKTNIWFQIWIQKVHFSLKDYKFKFYIRKIFEKKTKTFKIQWKLFQNQKIIFGNWIKIIKNHYHQSRISNALGGCWTTFPLQIHTIHCIGHCKLKWDFRLNFKIEKLSITDKYLGQSLWLKKLAVQKWHCQSKVLTNKSKPNMADVKWKMNECRTRWAISDMAMKHHTLQPRNI